MTDTRALRETFEPRLNFSVAGYIRTMPQPTLRARVKFNPLSADRARREWWLGITDEHRAKDGVFLTLAAVEWEQLVGWLLSFGRGHGAGPGSPAPGLVKAAKDAAMHHGSKL